MSSVVGGRCIEALFRGDDSPRASVGARLVAEGLMAGSVWLEGMARAGKESGKRG